MATRLLVYGATGFTGRLIAAHAREGGIAPVLAGRDAGRVRAVAEPLGLPWTAFGLDDPARLDEALKPFGAVLNIAGPFAKTARPVAESCLRAGVHYLDVTGEPNVFQDLSRLDARAQERGVMLMPGVGFVVLATDCLAAHVAGRLPGASHLRLGFNATDAVSRGTLRTAMGQLAATAAVVREGRLLELPLGRLEHWFDYGRGMRASMALTWADLFTAPRTTGIPNVEVYAEADWAKRNFFVLCGMLAGPLSSRPARLLMAAPARLWPEGPSQARRGAAPRVLVAEAENRHRVKVVSRLHTPDGYDFTPGAALAVAARVLDGDFLPGFQTPGKVYGADFVLALPGVRREDLDGHGRPLPPS
jgi:short subunit dehydrogenase-like uncharacterized protein